MSIRLSEFITDRCLALLRLGNMLGIFQGDLWTRGIIVTHRLHVNQLFIQDVQDLQRLGDVILESDEIQESLREEILALKSILNVFIHTAAAPAMTCGRWL